MEEPVASISIDLSDCPSNSDVNTVTDPKLDFMKYFKPNTILSGEQLYNYSRRAEKSVPSKGGHKDFEPDESCLQAKKMDMFYSRMETLLTEPRTEKLGSLLVGIWDPEKNLVEYKKDARKFWAKMGFVDEKRKWLYPEEALYLMEITVILIFIAIFTTFRPLYTRGRNKGFSLKFQSPDETQSIQWPKCCEYGNEDENNSPNNNCLEVYNNEVPLSLQEAYHIFIRTPENRNQYQVYAHLRRLGYSVIRHQGRSDTSQYEQSLKLDQYLKDGHNKKRKICKNNSDDKCFNPEKDNGTESANTEGNLCKRLKTENASKIQDVKQDDSKCFSIDLNSPSNAGRIENLMGTSGNQCEEENSNPRNTNVDCKPVPEKIGPESQHITRMSSLLHTQEADCEKIKEPAEMELEDSSRKIKSPCLTPESEEVPSLHCDPNKNCDPDSCQIDNFQTAQMCNSWFLDKTDNGSISQISDTADNNGRLSPNFLSDIKKLQVLNDDSKTTCKMSMYPKWDFQEYNFPNIASLTQMTCPHPADSVTVPLLGKPLPEGNLYFDIQEYRETVMNQHKYYRTSRGQTEVLEFSFQSKYQNKKKEAKNWAEYKQLCALENQEKMSISPLQVLWDGEVTPLVAPEDATSTDAILKKLQIVKHAQLHVCSMAKRIPDCPEKWTVVFDVYQPNAKFKKSNPGLPYFRVCVCGVDENPPTISDVIKFSRYFADGVPMNWAVVDNGEISFYIFQGVCIPEKP